jgi:hypothetical protein
MAIIMGRTPALLGMGVGDVVPRGEGGGGRGAVTGSHHLLVVVGDGELGENVVLVLAAVAVEVEVASGSRSTSLE